MKDIRNYENMYAVTEDGRVWSYKSNKFLKQTLLNRGYLQVELYNNGVGKKFLIHRLVAEAYLPNPDNLPQVNHKDENRQNNSVENLEWCTEKENDNYGNRNKNIARANATAVRCVELDRIFESISEAARELNLCTSNICRCLKKQSRTTGGYHWEVA